MESLILKYKELLHMLAESAAGTLELIGILIIVIGSFRALIRLLRCLIGKQPFHAVIDLGKALSFALEFKMGAEIIKTVIIRDLKELVILGAVILIRALLAFIIHWEIRLEKSEDREKNETRT